MSAKKKSTSSSTYDPSIFVNPDIDARYEMEQKQWTVKVKDFHYAISYGKMDAAKPTNKQTDFKTNDEALETASKKIQEKLGEGYKLKHDQGSMKTTDPKIVREPKEKK